MEEHNISYFRDLWQTIMTDLQNQCEAWKEICINCSVPDEVHGDIRTNIGLTKLLMNQKLKQFKGLIDDAELNTGEKEITCLDLQGFWDMVYNEVEKVKKCFNRLEKCKNNEWRFEDESSERLQKKKIRIKKEVAASSKKDDSSKSHTLAAKQRLAEVKKKIFALRKQQKQQNFAEINEANKDSFNQAQNQDSEDKVLNTTDYADTVVIKDSKDFEDICVTGRKISSVKMGDPVETVIRNVEPKCKAANLEKCHAPSIKDKENFVPDDDSSNIKYKSKMQAKSIEKGEASSNKKRGKPKDFGKLQCITRSAKKALLAQQNTM